MIFAGNYLPDGVIFQFQEGDLYGLQVEALRWRAAIFFNEKFMLIYIELENTFHSLFNFPKSLVRFNRSQEVKLSKEVMTGADRVDMLCKIQFVFFFYGIAY